MESHISVNNLRVSIKNKVIIDIPNLLIKKGEKVCLLGENGSGKTSLILALSGLIKLSSGYICFNGKKVERNISKSDFLKKIAIVFQNSLLIDDTVWNNIALGLKFRKSPKHETEKRVADIIRKLNLEGIKNRNVKTLSGGEAQRVNLARALVLDPEILFLDEPFSAIDSISRDSLISDLSKILKEKEITLIMSTHDKHEAFRLCDRFIVLEKGKILVDDDLNGLIKNPFNQFVAGFIGYETIIDGVIVAKEEGMYTAEVGNKKIFGVGNFEIGDKIIMCINPENVIVSKKTPQEKTSIRNCFEGKVVEITNLGLYYRVVIDCSFTIVSHITSKALEELKIEKGSIVFVEFKALSVHSFKKIS